MSRYKGKKENRARDIFFTGRCLKKDRRIWRHIVHVRRHFCEYYMPLNTWILSLGRPVSAEGYSETIFRKQVACAYCTYIYIRWYIDRTEHWFFHTRIYVVYYSFLYIVSTRYALVDRKTQAHCKTYKTNNINIVWQKEIIAATAREYEAPVTIQLISIGRNPPSPARRKKSRRRRRRSGSTGRPRSHPPTVTPARIPTTASNDL